MEQKPGTGTKGKLVVSWTQTQHLSSRVKKNLLQETKTTGQKRQAVALLRHECWLTPGTCTVSHSPALPHQYSTMLSNLTNNYHSDILSMVICHQLMRRTLFAGSRRLCTSKACTLRMFSAQIHLPHLWIYGEPASHLRIHEGEDNSVAMFRFMKIHQMQQDASHPLPLLSERSEFTYTQASHLLTALHYTPVCRFGQLHAHYLRSSYYGRVLTDERHRCLLADLQQMSEGTFRDLVHTVFAPRGQVESILEQEQERPVQR
jgi:hypothetical protein